MVSDCKVSESEAQNVFHGWENVGMSDVWLCSEKVHDFVLRAAKSIYSERV